MDSEAKLRADKVAALAQPPQPAPSVTEADELVSILTQRCDENFDGECHLTNAEAGRIITFVKHAARPDQPAQRPTDFSGEGA
jgi:hypothetical protein